MKKEAVIILVSNLLFLNGPLTLLGDLMIQVSGTYVMTDHFYRIKSQLNKFCKFWIVGRNFESSKNLIKVPFYYNSGVYEVIKKMNYNIIKQIYSLTVNNIRKFVLNIFDNDKVYKNILNNSSPVKHLDL